MGSLFLGTDIPDTQAEQNSRKERKGAKTQSRLLLLTAPDESAWTIQAQAAESIAGDYTNMM